jgi:carboxyl-terminal processing protease
MLSNLFNRSATGVAATVLAFSSIFYGSCNSRELDAAERVFNTSAAAIQAVPVKTSIMQAVPVKDVAEAPAAANDTPAAPQQTAVQVYTPPNGSVVTNDVRFYQRVLEYVDREHVTGKTTASSQDMVEAATKEILQEVARQRFFDKKTQKFDTSAMTFGADKKMASIKFPSGVEFKAERPNVSFNSYRDQALYLRSFISAIELETGIDEKDLYHAALNGALHASRDQHTSYMTPDAFEKFMERMNAQFAGAGFSIKDESGKLTAQKVFAGSPAEKAGIQTGDVITHIDGQDIGGLSLQEVVEKIRGPINTDVKITVDRNGTVVDCNVTRGTVKVPLAEGEILKSSPDTAYVTFSSFGSDSYKELRDMCEKLMAEAKANGQTDVKLVLDLRNNGGGSLREVIKIADMFLEEDGGDRDVIVATGKTANDNQRFVDNYVPGRLGFAKVVILQNQNSASASEILAGALRDKGFEVVGSRSYGKGSVQRLFTLTAAGQPDYTFVNATGGAVKTTVELFFPGNSGLSNQDSGVQPTMEIKYNDFRDDVLANHKFGGQGGKNSSLVDVDDTRQGNAPALVASLKPAYAGELSDAQVAALPEEFISEWRVLDQKTKAYKTVRLFDAELAAAIYSITGQSDYLDVEAPAAKPATAPVKTSTAPAPINRRLGLG